MAQQIEELRYFFNTFGAFPDTPYRLNSYSTILDFVKYIKSNLTIAENYNNKVGGEPYLTRLIELKNHLTNYKNEQPISV